MDPGKGADDDESQSSDSFRTANEELVSEVPPLQP
jgi:hypothetical protein